MRLKKIIAVCLVTLLPSSCWHCMLGSARKSSSPCLSPLTEGLGKSSSQLILLRYVHHLIHSDIPYTSVTKASVTIEGVKYVVDCGFVKVGHNPCAYLTANLILYRFVHIILRPCFHRSQQYPCLWPRPFNELAGQAGPLPVNATAYTLNPLSRPFPSQHYRKLLGWTLRRRSYS